jgi:hypothetical protein
MNTRQMRRSREGLLIVGRGPLPFLKRILYELVSAVTSIASAFSWFAQEKAKQVFARRELCSRPERCECEKSR